MMSRSILATPADGESIKIVGNRRKGRRNLLAAAPFLELIVRLHDGKLFIPKGIHRFHSFEESQQWSIRMMTRGTNPDHQL